jgi:hypothetical protein
MKTTLLIVIILSFSTLGHSQKYSSIISDNEIEEFIQWKINKEIRESKKYKSSISVVKLFHQPEKWRNAQTDIFSFSCDTISFEIKLFSFLQSDTVFNQEDRVFLSQQYDSEIVTDWNEQFDNVKLKKKFGKNNYKMTIPLFSKDKSKLIVWVYYYCGSLCASATVFIYEKIDENSWKLIGTYGRWES